MSEFYPYFVRFR